ncbi:MAG: cytochrome c [Elusimicrobia bacterium]|nr:cytochrome c [Elusimicrobiota bacterium]
MKFLASLVLLACVSTSASAKDPGAELGKQYFDGFGCNRCHIVGGKGGNYGPDLTFIGYRKKKEWLDLWLKDPHAWKANTPMPNFHMSENVREALVAYLVTLKGESYQTARPWNHPDYASDSVKKGAKIFQMAGCIGCHGRNGVGGFPNNNVQGGRIPTLTKTAEGYSKDELKTKIANGVPKPEKADSAGADPMIHMPAWKEVLKDDEIDALADYLISLKPKGAAGDAW